MLSKGARGSIKKNSRMKDAVLARIPRATSVKLLSRAQKLFNPGQAKHSKLRVVLSGRPGKN